MKFEEQVCSLRLANRLKELGVKQESLFYHWATEIENDGLTWWIVSEKEPRKGKRIRELPGKQPISAFTVAELGEMIKEANTQGANINVPVLTTDGSWTSIPHGLSIEITESEANARAKMLIYLLENKLINLN